MPQGFRANRGLQILAFGVLLAGLASVLFLIGTRPGSKRAQTVQGQIGLASSSAELCDAKLQRERREPLQDRGLVNREAFVSLQLLSMSDLMPASGSVWRVKGFSKRKEDKDDPEEEAEYTADTQGITWIPPGRWKLCSVDAAWSPLDPTIEALAGTRLVAWVQRLGTRRFRVTSPLGDPIEGVRSIWVPRRATEDSTDQSALITVESDRSGLVEFSACPCDNGTAVFLHPDFERQELSICGPPDGIVPVVLGRASLGRRLWFTRLDQATQVTDILLASPEGYEVARSESDSPSLVLPSWVQGNEPLLVTSPTTHPCLLTLSRLSDDEIALPGRRVAKIAAEDSSGCTGRISIEFRLLSTEESPEDVEPIRPALVELEAPSEVAVGLPAGMRIVVRASNPCGAFGQVEIAADELEPRTTVSLQFAESLLIRVTDRSGYPIRSAVALPGPGGGFLSDNRGEIRIPFALGLSFFTVFAEGYSPVVVSRNAPTRPQTGGEQMSVMLEPSQDVTFVVRSESGTPLAGMRVSVWSSGGAASVSNATWVPGLVKGSVAGATDASGRFLARGLSAGAAEVEVDLPPEIGTDPYLRSAYPAVVFHHVLAHGGEYLLEVPSPRHLSLEVICAATNEPVRGFELRAEDGAVAPVEVRGSYWQGWVSSALKQLVVVADGVGSATVSLVLATPNRVLRVAVSHGPRVLLRVADLPARAQGLELFVHVMRSTPDGLHLERTLTVEASGEASIELGDIADPWIGIAELQTGGSRLRFEPEFQAAPPGGVASFRCVE